MNEIYLAGGCVWGVQEFFRYVPGVIDTQAGRANGSTETTEGPYDGYAECVRIRFDDALQSVPGLITELFDIIDPHSVNQQGDDVGEKYRTGIYSSEAVHLEQAQAFINERSDTARIVVEVLPLSNFVKSDLEHQDRLLRCPGDHCHISTELMRKYKK